MNNFKSLIFFTIWTAMLSCKSKEHDDGIINTGLDEIHLPNREAENVFNKGFFYIRQENYSAAKHFFLMADEESPNTPVILNAIGNCMDGTGNSRKARLHFRSPCRYTIY